MRKYVVPVIAAIVSVLFILPPSVFSLENNHAGKKPLVATDIFGKRLAALGLTQEQKGRIRRIFIDHNTALAPKMEEYIQKRRAFRKMSNNADANQNEIYELAQRIAQLKGDLAVEKIAIMKEILPVLTPEQTEKFKLPAPNSPPQKELSR